MLHNVKINAGQHTEIAKQGKFINVVLAAGEIEARIHISGGQAFQTKLVSGMAFPVPQGFQSASFSSDTSQQMKIWLGDLPLTYSPLEAKFVGASAVKSSSGVIGYGTPKVLVPPLAGRGKVTISAKEDIYIGGVGLTPKNAVLVPANQPVSIATQGAIYGYSDNPDNTTVEVATANSVEDFKFQSKKDNPDFNVVFYSKATDKYYSIDESGIQERNISDYSVVKAIATVSNGDHVNTLESACPSFVEHAGLFHFLVSKGGRTDLLTFDPVKETVEEVELLSVGGEIKDYKLDVTRNKIAALIKINGTLKFFIGNMTALTEKAIPTLSAYGTSAILLLDDSNIILYGYDHYAKSANDGDSWDAKKPLQFNFSYYSGVTKDKSTGYIFAASQYALYRSSDGETWQLMGNWDGNKYQWYIGGGQIFAVGEYNLVFSNNSGETIESLDLSTWYSGANNNTRNVIPCSNGSLFVINPNDGILRFGGDVSVSGGVNVALLEEVN